MGRLIDGWEASEIRSDTKEAYKNGSDSNEKPRLLRNMKKRNRHEAFNPINNEMPTPIICS